MLWLIFASDALAAPPDDLDGLVALALQRDPAAVVLERDADAARANESAARRPMNPVAMLGVDALGAMPESGDVTMGMIGVEQMLQGWGQARAQAARAHLDVSRAESDGVRLAADVRLLLEQEIIRIQAWQADRALLDVQIRQAETLREVGLRRWGSGAGAGAPGGMQGGGGGMETPSVAPPRLAPKGRAGGGMPGMGGGGATRMSPGMPAGEMAGGEMSSGQMSSGQMSPMGSSGALAELLRVDASAAMLLAERAELDARLRGERARLGVYVGDEAADAVVTHPDAYRSPPLDRPAPELELAVVDRRVAAAEVAAARAQLAPDLMLSVTERFMPDGMPAGTDLMVGVELPLWGRHRADLAAARASEAAAGARAETIRRDLDAALATARAAEEAAGARLGVLGETAVPRANQAWEAALARYAAGFGSVEDVLRAWEASVTAQRALVAAVRDHELRAAERARVEGR